jgi:hypothetical protein
MSRGITGRIGEQEAMPGVSELPQLGSSTAARSTTSVSRMVGGGAPAEAPKPQRVMPTT